MRNAEFGMRNVTVGLVTRTTHPCNSAFHIPHSALGSHRAPSLSPRPLLPPPLLLLRLLHRGPQAHPRAGVRRGGAAGAGDRKSTRLNSSHGYISYAVFCLKKKTK